MEQQREMPAWPVTATEQERAEARARFRRKLAEADARMTPDKRARALAVFGLDASAVE
jgi:crotonobetainyl-CoA:carnitine CoA-transferase CaiB-like acyl-CoA transferase